MAVTKSLTTAVPYEKNSKVEEWYLGFTYENDSEGDATYYKNSFKEHIYATDSDGTVNFTPKAKADWTKSEIEALAPTSEWDIVFAAQVDSAITNPVVNPIADSDFSIPE